MTPDHYFRRFFERILISGAVGGLLFGIIQLFRWLSR